MKKISLLSILTITFATININCMNMKQITIGMMASEMTKLNLTTLTLYQKMAYAEEIDNTLTNIKNIKNEIKNYECIKKFVTNNMLSTWQNQLNKSYSELENLVINTITKSMQLEFPSLYPYKPNHPIRIGGFNIYYNDVKKIILQDFGCLPIDTNQTTQNLLLMQVNLNKLNKKLEIRKSETIKKIAESIKFEKLKLKKSIKSINQKTKQFEIIANTNQIIQETNLLLKPDKSAESTRKEILSLKYRLSKKENEAETYSKIISGLKNTKSNRKEKILALDKFAKKYKIQNPQAKKDLIKRAQFILSL